MRTVTFPYQKGSGNLIAYPDDITKFRKSTIHNGSVVAEYFGDLPLDDYVGELPEALKPRTRPSVDPTKARQLALATLNAAVAAGFITTQERDAVIK